MKRYLDLDDGLDAPLELMGWYLDATVKARITAMVNTETFDAHGPTGQLQSYKLEGDTHSYEIDWIEIGPTLVCKDSVGEHCIKLDQSSIPVGMRRAFEQAVERAVIAKAKTTIAGWKDDES